MNTTKVKPHALCFYIVSLSFCVCLPLVGFAWTGAMSATRVKLIALHFECVHDVSNFPRDRRYRFLRCTT